MLKRELTSLGLSEKETEVYLSLLELGEGSIAQITKKSGVKRATVYLEIEKLKEKGLVSSVYRKKRVIFFAESPNKLKNSLEEKLQTLNVAMPELMALANKIDKKPKIRFFEGEEGIREVYKDTLNYPEQEILLWGTEDFVTYSDEEYFLNHYIPKRKEKNIWVRAIAPKSEIISRYQDNNQNQLRKMKVVETTGFNFSVEIDLYGKNKIMVASFQEKFGMIIESQKMYETLRGIFEIMWASLPDKNFSDRNKSE
ncbi:MAG: hypothetical protein M0P97_01275 [Candidatus Moranbacteria bacterium]|jgi:predicted transcriptional regulator|nr:hypothetical protein [Candidatus Moranbacteria bacterium]